MTTLIIILTTYLFFECCYWIWKQYQPNTPPKPIKEPQQAKTTEIEGMQDETDIKKIHSIEWDAGTREVIDIKLN